MKTEYEIPKDATHYFLWCGELYIYKKCCGVWYWFVCGNWVKPTFHISWWFGYHLNACGYQHKLHKITYEL